MIIFALALFILPTAQAKQSGAYDFIDIMYPGSDWTFASDINAGGQIVGHFGYNVPPYESHGFYFYKGVFSEVKIPGATAVAAGTISEQGRIAGMFVDASGVEHGYTLYNGKLTVIDYPGAVATDTWGTNQRKQANGVYYVYNDLGWLLPHAYLLYRGEFIDIDPPDAVAAIASTMNARGHVVGFYTTDFSDEYGFLYDNGNFTKIEFPGAFWTDAYGINDNGKIVGGFGDKKGGHGYILDKGIFTQIDVPDSLYTRTNCINTKGQIVGMYVDSSGNQKGFIANKISAAPPALGSESKVSTTWASIKYK